MTAAEGGGLRKRRRKDPFVQVDRRTVRDYRMPFRALGVLTYLLDRPDGWVVRSESIAKDGAATGESKREGRDAVRAALRALAELGYYRVERRQVLKANGKYEFEMGTAISELPVQAWVEQYKAFDGKPIPIRELPGGGFVVVMPDGTLQPDDFDEFDDEADVGSERAVQGSEPAAESQEEPSGSEPADDRSEAPILPAPEPVRADRPQRGTTHRADDPPPQVQPTLDAQVPATREPTPAEIAQDVAQGWLAYLADREINVVWRGKGTPIHGIRSLVEPALRSGYTDREIKFALMLCLERDRTTFASAQQLDRWLQRVRHDGERPGQPSKQQVPRQSDVRHIDDLTPEERAARNPFAGATRSSDVLAGAGASS